MTNIFPTHCFETPCLKQALSITSVIQLCIIVL